MREWPKRERQEFCNFTDDRKSCWIFHENRKTFFPPLALSSMSTVSTFYQVSSCDVWRSHSDLFPHLCYKTTDNRLKAAHWMFSHYHHVLLNAWRVRLQLIICNHAKCKNCVSDETIHYFHSWLIWLIYRLFVLINWIILKSQDVVKYAHQTFYCDQKLKIYLSWNEMKNFVLMALNRQMITRTVIDYVSGEKQIDYSFCNCFRFWYESIHYDITQSLKWWNQASFYRLKIHYGLSFNSAIFFLQFIVMTDEFF